MPFDAVDYERASARRQIPVPRTMAVSAIKSSDETFWVVNGRLVVRSALRRTVSAR